MVLPYVFYILIIALQCSIISATMCKSHNKEICCSQNCGECKSCFASQDEFAVYVVVNPNAYNYIVPPGITPSGTIPPATPATPSTPSTQPPTQLVPTNTPSPTSMPTNTPTPQPTPAPTGLRKRNVQQTNNSSNSSAPSNTPTSRPTSRPTPAPTGNRTFNKTFPIIYLGCCIEYINYVGENCTEAIVDVCVNRNYTDSDWQKIAEFFQHGPIWGIVLASIGIAAVVVLLLYACCWFGIRDPPRAYVLVKKPLPDNP